MSVILGTGEHRYRVVENWAKLPDGWEFMDCAAVGVDSKDQVYVFNRGEHPMIVFDREGNFLRSWGEGVFKRAHGLHIDKDDILYCTDDGDHSVRKCTPDGKVLMTMGVPGRPAPFMSNEPFHRCTHTALSPKGEIYVSDGYGNCHPTGCVSEAVCLADDRLENARRQQRLQDDAGPLARRADHGTHGQ